MSVISLRNLPEVGRYNIKEKSGLFKCFYNNSIKCEMEFSNKEDAKRYCTESLKRKFVAIIKKSPF